MGIIRNLDRDRRGVALVEFALVAPVVVVLLLGALGYGQYFLLAHSVQQIANDAARATVSGLTAPERVTLAQASIARGLAALPEIRAASLSSAVTETSDLVTVRVRLDAGTTPLLRMTLVPMPDAIIERRAIARPGGIA